MPPLSDSALARMRQQAQTLMPDAWSLVHPVPADDGQGHTDTWTVTASGTGAQGTGGRFMPAGYQAAEQQQAGRLTAIFAWAVTLPVGTPVRMQDRIIMGVALTVGTAVTDFSVYRVFEVTGTSAGHTYETATKVAAQEVS